MKDGRIPAILLTAMLAALDDAAFWPKDVIVGNLGVNSHPSSRQGGDRVDDGKGMAHLRAQETYPYYDRISVLSERDRDRISLGIRKRWYASWGIVKEAIRGIWAKGGSHGNAHEQASVRDRTGWVCGNRLPCRMLRRPRQAGRAAGGAERADRRAVRGGLPRRPASTTWCS